MKYKFEIINFKVEEKEQFETHLNEMSEKHWNLKWFNEYVICYERSEERKYYYIDFNQHVKLNSPRYIDNDQKKQIALYEDMDYVFCTSFKYFMVYHADRVMHEVHTDEDLKAVVIKNAKKSYRFLNVYFPALMLLLVFIINFSRPSSILFILSNNIVILLFLLIIVLTLLQTIYTFYAGRSKAYGNTTKHIKRRTSFVVALYTVLLLAVATGLYAMTQNTVYAYMMIFLLVLIYVFRFVLTTVMSQSDSSKKGLLAVGVIIVYVCIYMIMYRYMVTQDIDDTSLSNGYKNLFTEQVSGKITKVESYTNSMDSVLLKNIVFYAQTENDGYFDYQYYEDKTGLLRGIVMRVIQEYCKLKHAYSIDDVKVYLDADSLDMLSTEGEELTWPSQIVLEKGHEIIKVFSSDAFDKEKIELIIKQLNW